MAAGCPVGTLELPVVCFKRPHGTKDVPGRFGMFLKIPLEQLSVLCQNVATCLSAGLGVPASLRASVRSSGHGALKGIVETAAEHTASGVELSEALEPSNDRLPPFFLPVVRCGEQSGRLDEAFHYLARHCHLMVRPSRMARNAWLFPLVIVLTGSVIKIALVAAFAPIAVTVAYAGSTMMSYAMAAALMGVVLFVPQIRAILDRVRLAVPVVGPTERDLAVSRFFQALNRMALPCVSACRKGKGRLELGVLRVSLARISGGAQTVSCDAAEGS